MKKSELKNLIKEVVTEINTGEIELSKKALEVINFLRDNESRITHGEKEKQNVRRVISNLHDLLNDADYKILNPGTTIGKMGGGEREDFAAGT